MKSKTSMGKLCARENLRCILLDSLLDVFCFGSSETVENKIKKIFHTLEISENGFSKNKLLDIFIKSKLYWIEKYEIKFRSNIQKVSNFDYIDSYDFFELLKNVVDSAIHACRKIKDKNLRQIYLGVFEYDGFLNIDISNATKNSEISEDLKSTAHVEKILDKYNGYAEECDANHRFSLNIRFPSIMLQELAS